MSIADKLNRLTTVRTNVRSALVAKGVTAAATHNLEDFAGDIAAIQTGGTGDWIRPSDWLEIDSLVTAGEQKTVGLYAVYPNNNTLGMTNTVAFTVTGNHTIDWGDGSAPENVNSNVQAQHLYDYNTISSATNCTRGYRQVRITITPQSGQNITNLQFGKKHSSVVFGRIVNQWLDIVISGTHLTTFRFSEISYANLLEKVKAMQSTNACTSMSSMFLNCYSLQSVDLSSFNTASVTNMSYMFSGCYSLKSLDLSNFNTAALTNMSAMFYVCYSLQSLDLSNFNTASVTNMSYMFSGCYSLQSIDLSSFNTAAVTNMSYMFTNCSSLKSIDLSSFNTAAVTNMSYMFTNCYSLQSLDLSNFNTASVTNMSYMFSGCYSLQSIDLSVTTLAAVTDNTNIFNLTISLIKCRVPNIGKTFTVANNPLSETELNLLFGDLKDLTSGTTQTITITGCIGAATCDKTIATNKNWTVIG